MQALACYKDQADEWTQINEEEGLVTLVTLES